MILQNHMVKKFLVELNTPGYSQSNALQRRCTTAVKEKVVAGMDAVLAGNFPSNETVRINRIEIDLGNVEAGKLEEAFSEKLLVAFTKEIEKIAASRKKETEENAGVPDENTLLIEQFFYFLKKGILPWNQFYTSFESWEQYVLQAIEKQSQYFATKFTELLRHSPAVAERLLLQFNSRFIVTVVEAALPFLKAKLQLLIQSVKANAEAEVSEKIILTVLQKIFVAAFNFPGKKNVDTVIENIAAVPVNSMDEKANLQKLHTAITDFFNYLQTDIGAKLNTAIKPIELKPAKQPVENSEAEDEKRNSIETSSEQDESIFIQNAGLILLHPFLGNLFSACELMENKKFTNSGAANKAVQLLQYLVNGQTEMPEYFLTLNKILCGLPHGEHIDRFIKLSAKEYEEALELLQAVIQHWDVLKGSSPQALQETFLQRTGKLSLNAADKYWKLQVEKKGVDILLEKIPWGYSYIQLPWMEFPLVTEW